MLLRTAQFLKKLICITWNCVAEEPDALGIENPDHDSSCNHLASLRHAIEGNTTADISSRLAALSINPSNCT